MGASVFHVYCILSKQYCLTGQASGVHLQSVFIEGSWEILQYFKLSSAKEILQLELSGILYIHTEQRHPLPLHEFYPLPIKLVHLPSILSEPKFAKNFSAYQSALRGPAIIRSRTAAQFDWLPTTKLAVLVLRNLGVSHISTNQIEKHVKLCQHTNGTVSGRHMNIHRAVR